MSYTIKIRQFEAPVVADIGQTILEAAFKEGLDYPCGCRSGNCGACKSSLLGGEVEMSPYSEFALTDEEKAAGLILACRAVPWSDCEVAYLEPDEVAVHPQRRLACRVIGLADATHDIKVVRLRVDSGGPFSFSAGQYARVTFPGQPPRDYSMATRPDEEELEFHIRHIPGGAVSTFVAETLAVGEKVEVEGPYGISQLRENHTGPIVALAGGSGLAPIMSIIETALARGMGQKIDLYFGVRDERDLYLEQHFRELAKNHVNLNFTPVLSDPSGDTPRRTGVLADAVRTDFNGLDGAKAYLAGPPIMVETCVAALQQAGVNRENCHADAFYTEAEKTALETQ